MIFFDFQIQDVRQYRHLFLIGCSKILEIDEAYSNTAANVTLTKCQQKRHVSIL